MEAEMDRISWPLALGAVGSLQAACAVDSCTPRRTSRDLWAVLISFRADRACSLALKKSVHGRDAYSSEESVHCSALKRERK